MPMSVLKHKNFSRIIFYAILGILLYLFYYYWLGCVAGGGGSSHTPPKSFPFGQPIILELQFSRWAAPQCLSSKTSDSFSNAKCHYRSATESSFETISMVLIKDEKEEAIYQCAIPYPPKSTKIEYYFDFKSNGVYDRRDEKPLIVRE